MSGKFNRDDIDKFFDYGIDLSTNTLYIGSGHGDSETEGGVDHLLAERVVKGLHLLDARASNGITIKMNNIGGEVYHGLAIYDAIKACKNHITIIVYGNAMSMGSIILQAADRRIMMPHATVMIHHGHTGYSGHPKSFINAAKEEKRLIDVTMDIYMKRIQEKHPKSRVYNRAFLDKLLNFDTFIPACEAVTIGLADEVWVEEND